VTGGAEAASGDPAAPGNRLARAGLPLLLTRFFGREGELAELDGALAPGSATRLVTLTGSPGNGETRLALETARRLAETYAEPVWFVPLAALHDPAAIPDAVAMVMRLPGPGRRTCWHR